MSTIHSSVSTALVTLVIEQLLHPALKFAVSASFLNKSWRRHCQHSTALSSPLMYIRHMVDVPVSRSLLMSSAVTSIHIFFSSSDCTPLSAHTFAAVITFWCGCRLSLMHAVCVCANLASWISSVMNVTPVCLTFLAFVLRRYLESTFTQRLSLVAQCLLFVELFGEKNDNYTTLPATEIYL